MSNGADFRYRRAILSLIAVLLIFLSLVDVGLVLHQRDLLLDETRKDTFRELTLMGTFARENLLKQDYVVLEQFLTQWGEEHVDVVELEAIAPNKFVLARYAIRKPPEHTFRVEHQVKYEGQHLISLSMVKDLTPVHESFLDLIKQLALRSALLATILGVTLWFTFKNIALRPLEKEINRRQQAEDKFRDLLEGAPDAMVLVNQKGKILLVNQQIENLFGYSRGELLGSSVESLMAEHYRAKHRVYVRDYLATAQARAMGMHFESRGLRKDGKEFPVDVSLRPLITNHEMCVLIDVRDATERKEAEEALRESEEKFRTLVENINVGIYRNTGGTHGRFIQANPAIVKIFGYESLDEFMKMPVSEFYQNPDERKIFVQEALEKGFLKNKELRLKKKDGTPILASCNAKVQYARDGSIKWIDGVIEDITERKQAEEKIARGYRFQSTISEVLKISLEPISFEKQLDQILGLILGIPWLSLQSKGCIFLVEEEPDFLIMKAQRGFEESMRKKCAKVPFGKCLCGQAAAGNHTVFADHLAEPHEKHEEQAPHGQFCVPISSGERMYGVLNVLLKEGHQRDPHEEMFLDSIADTLAGIIEHRKTELEKEKLQIQLLQSEKLSALGRMTASVAHEIRNPLTALGGLTRRLDRKIPDDSKEKEYTKIIVAEAIRLEKILNSVLSFTGKDSFKEEKCNINELIADSIKLFKEMTDQRVVTVQSDLTDVRPVKVDKEKVREVIDNLITNALDAMPDGGQIRIGTEERHLQGACYILVTVTDTGKGISEKELSKIFEPFFTTKGVGPRPGIGLGLSICKKIIEQHDGFMRVESEVGKGTTFKLFLPCSM